MNKHFVSAEAYLEWALGHDRASAMLKEIRRKHNLSVFQPVMPRGRRQAQTASESSKEQIIKLARKYGYKPEQEGSV